ncbi:uncharacterized protein BCR38DRAFT_55222 [Pseudomassariella vexata]|uniref:RBR-type E3 ubiquitin transferase n=1 Tax=Pseudomassariella vexata TaxID=1141098 RepID=A0A1Y2DM02_9PEZI|nr:uncharacterized protein BCR38DRAFT_55222 [Pseudomassariella vexata]ORY60166.1 hypothetical protein BCR38DRAFT_55222 [Pseudomassariella vexata]
MVKFTTKHRHHSRPHRHRHDYHRHRYSYQRSRYQDESDEDSDTEPPEEEKRIEIDLLDLDGLREKMKIGIRPTSQLDHVATFLRRRYHGDRYENSISKDARIAFYWMEKHLTGPEIPTGLSLLRYRVLSSSQDDESLQITWNSRLDLEPEQLEQIEEDILEGKTVANLRRSIAAHLGVEDPNRVVISACGGLRPGVLQGSHWEAKSIETWLCRHLYIGLESPGNYVILHGLNQEYVYHPPPGSRSSRFLDIQMLKTWLRGEVITNVHQRSSSQIEVDEDDIRLLSKGKWLTKRSRIGLGAMVDFELSHSVEGRFLEEEAWLVPSTETCIVCSEDKRASEMPRRVTEACEHEAQTCKDCVSQWIVSSLDTVTWDRLRCPECPKLLRFEDVRQFASPEVFDRYDILATKAVVTEFRDFRWCLNPRCGSGQIHRDSCPRVKCHACKASSCSYHNVPWHSKETCEAYDRRTKKQRKNDKASEKRVKEITKSCPKCRRDVHKYSGCDHITCESFPSPFCSLSIFLSSLEWFCA